MERLKKLFGGTDLTWKKVILLAIAAGVYTAIMALLPITKDTSFADITISFEVWILFGIFIIMNSRTPLDSGLKCFVFFLISQPLVYLIQVPFSELGFGIFSYYRYWFIWTILTLPMGIIGHLMKRGKWWGLLILTPMLILLGIHYEMFLAKTIYYFPHHLLSTIFCIVTLLIYPAVIFESKKIKAAGLIISVLIIAAMTVYAYMNRSVYNTVLLSNGGEAGAEFDGSCTAYLEDSRYGEVEVVYNEAIENYMVEAELKHGGKTALILERADGTKEIYDLNIRYSDYDIEKR